MRTADLRPPRPADLARRSACTLSYHADDDNDRIVASVTSLFLFQVLTKPCGLWAAAWLSRRPSRPDLKAHALDVWLSGSFPAGKEPFGQVISDHLHHHSNSKQFLVELGFPLGRTLARSDEFTSCAFSTRAQVLSAPDAARTAEHSPCEKRLSSHPWSMLCGQISPTGKRITAFSPRFSLEVRYFQHYPTRGFVRSFRRSISSIVWIATAKLLLHVSTDHHGGDFDSGADAEVEPWTGVNLGTIAMWAGSRNDLWLRVWVDVQPVADFGARCALVGWLERSPTKASGLLPLLGLSLRHSGSQL
jgi:hypothetical protein